MNYLDVYFSRINYFGETPAERVKNSGMIEFEKWKAQSPFTVSDLSVERGLYFSGIIQTNKDKEESKIMFLYVAVDIPIMVGDILTWRQDNGVVEKWLLLQKEHKVHETYQTFQIIKCNYNLKWIDTQGYLHQSWAYAVSSVDSKVKGNFRMWHSLISPQPNKFAEIIMPRPVFSSLGQDDMDQLMRGIVFIIENEGWVVIECDWTSVEGIVYMSLTESKVNYQNDDRNIDVADLDRYKFPVLPTIYKVGETIIPQFEADTLNQWEVELIKPDDCTFINDDFVAVAPGQCHVTMRLKHKPNITKEVEINIFSDNEEIVAYIDGPDDLKLDRKGIFTLSSTSYINNELVEMSITAGAEYATLQENLNDQQEIIPNSYILHANNKNKLGKVILTASYNGIQYSKTVNIIPLW